jgi:hypothetical protein
LASKKQLDLEANYMDHAQFMVQLPAAVERFQLTWTLDDTIATNATVRETN